MKATLVVFVFTLVVLVAGAVQAQTDAEAAGPETPNAEAETPTDDEDEAFLKGGGEEEQTEKDKETEDDAAYLEDREKAEIEAPEEEKNIGRYEDPKTPFYSVGARVRWLMVPEWFIKMFGAAIDHPKGEERHLLVSNIGAGPEFTYRKDGFDITAAIWYAGLNWTATTAFKEDGEDDNSWEVVENDMRAIMITVDFIWSTALADWFAITYGAGLGLGIKWGDIIETDSWADENGRFVEKCPVRCKTDVNCANEYGGTCQVDEDYGTVWDKVPVVPWVNFLFGMRFKPHRHFAIYVDAGFGLGFQWGGRLAYIF